jgi:hypothetical protein
VVEKLEDILEGAKIDRHVQGLQSRKTLGANYKGATPGMAMHKSAFSDIIQLSVGGVKFTMCSYCFHLEPH